MSTPLVTLPITYIDGGLRYILGSHSIISVDPPGAVAGSSSAGYTLTGIPCDYSGSVTYKDNTLNQNFKFNFHTPPCAATTSSNNSMLWLLILLMFFIFILKKRKR